MQRYGEIVRYCPPSQLPGARSIGRDMLRQLYIRLSSCAVFARMGSIRCLYKEDPRWSPSLNRVDTVGLRRVVRPYSRVVDTRRRVQIISV